MYSYQLGTQIHAFPSEEDAVQLSSGKYSTVHCDWDRTYVTQRNIAKLERLENYDNNKLCKFYTLVLYLKINKKMWFAFILRSPNQARKEKWQRGLLQRQLNHKVFMRWKTWYSCRWLRLLCKSNDRNFLTVVQNKIESCLKFSFQTNYCYVKFTFIDEIMIVMGQ